MASTAYLENQSNESNYETTLYNQAWLLLVLLMFFAGLHKLISPQVRDGSYYATLFLRGELFKPIIALLSHFQDIISTNNQIISEFHSSQPSIDGGETLLSPSKQLPLISKVFSYMVIFGELAIPVAFIIFRKSEIRHLFLISILIGVFLSRLECGFLSIICILGYANTLPSSKLIRAIYVYLFVLFLSLASTDLAYS